MERPVRVLTFSRHLLGITFGNSWPTAVELTGLFRATVVAPLRVWVCLCVGSGVFLCSTTLLLGLRTSWVVFVLREATLL